MSVNFQKVCVQGIQVLARSIPTRDIATLWKMLTTAPLPKVTVLQLRDEDFDRIIQKSKCKADEEREMEEWGRILSITGTDACVYSLGDSEYVEYYILIRERPYHKIEEIIRHELAHIARGDL